MKNKRGFLLAEETLKIVIAVICLGFLIYFLTTLYIKNQDSKDLEFAKETLNRLVKDIDSGITEFEIYNPKGWVLISWFESDLPKFCSNLGWSDCICICNSDLKFWTNRIEECNELGTCVEREIQINENFIELEDLPLTLKINNGRITK